ncbi:hypothetical protein [Novosphingobium sp. Gsoil 351]|uniref:hypothetical protein n=1 Tax=Novosphingobium sp. Gsoil 351 TaxID=2675225 RepID=UPI001E3988FC|nr:hypothetical protein [Novosphingobium sp. Gsoil 351]
MAKAAEDYVARAFGATLKLKGIKPKSLPHFVLDQYRLWEGDLLGRATVLAAVRDRRTGTGATANFVKHRDLIQRETGAASVLLLLGRTTNAIRHQLIDRKIAFLAPDAQLYVPEALLDVRERSQAREPLRIDANHLSPTAQVLVLANLLGKDARDVSLTELADRFGSSVMSMSRAADELEARKIAKAHHVGRRRQLNIAAAGVDLWSLAQPYLRNPIRKVRRLAGPAPADLGLLAGESALAELTMLGRPRIERKAVPAAHWKQLSSGIALRPAGPFDDPHFEVETWAYDPCVLASGRTVDPLSLYLTMRDHADERTAQAADQLLEQFAW